MESPSLQQQRFYTLPSMGSRFGVSSSPTYSSALQSRPDTLTLRFGQNQRKVGLYCRETGFPDPQSICQTIDNHLRDALTAAEADTGLKVLYAGYDPTCSVANGQALPGSDADHFAVVVARATEAEKSQFQKRLQTHLDPTIVSTDNRHDDCNFVLTLDELHRLSETTPSSEPHLDQVDGFGSQAQCELARIIIWTLMDGSPLVSQLPEADRQKLTHSPMNLDNRARTFAQWIKDKPQKLKHQARKQLLTKFKQLSPDAQEWIIEHLQQFPKTETGIIYPNHKNRLILEGLRNEGLLVRLQESDPNQQEFLATMESQVKNPSLLIQIKQILTAPVCYVVPWRCNSVEEALLDKYENFDTEPEQE